MFLKRSIKSFVFCSFTWLVWSHRIEIYKNTVEEYPGNRFNFDFEIGFRDRKSGCIGKRFVFSLCDTIFLGIDSNNLHGLGMQNIHLMQKNT